MEQWGRSSRARWLFAALGSVVLMLVCGAGSVGGAYASAAPSTTVRSASGMGSPILSALPERSRVIPKAPSPAPGITGAGAAITNTDAAITSTSVLSEVVQSASGLTTVEVEPVIVRANGNLWVTIHSLRLAQAVLTLTYPDGETVQQRGRTNGQGYLAMKMQVLYQPLDRSAIATLTVQVTKDAQVETVPVTLSVLRQATLTQSRLIVRPLAIHVGQSLLVGVHSLSNVQVHITVTDPSGQTVSADGFTNANGNFATTIPVSYNPGRQRGTVMVVSAWLSYGGEQSFLRQTVPFVAR